jgi:hypothetical protein
MKGKYKAAFIIPIGTNKILGENGWEFETSNRLKEEVKEFLIDALRLKFLESYLQIDCYINENIKMSISYDDQKQIESIYFQTYNDTLTVLSDLFLAGGSVSNLELFIPNSTAASKKTL